MSPHAVITGAGSGIGRQIASRFAGIGYRLTLVDLDAASVATTVESCKEAGAEEAKALVVDLAAPAGPGEMVAEAWSTAPVDVLVNSAGIYPATPFLSLNAATWDAVQNLNTRAPLLATVALAQRAIEAGRRASVVNLSLIHI